MSVLQGARGCRVHHVFLNVCALGSVNIAGFSHRGEVCIYKLLWPKSLVVVQFN